MEFEASLGYMRTCLNNNNKIIIIINNNNNKRLKKVSGGENSTFKELLGK